MLSETDLIPSNMIFKFVAILFIEIPKDTISSLPSIFINAVKSPVAIFSVNKVEKVKSQIYLKKMINVMLNLNMQDCNYFMEVLWKVY